MKPDNKRYILSKMYVVNNENPYFIVDTHNKSTNTSNCYKCVYHGNLQDAVGYYVGFNWTDIIDSDDNLTELIERVIVYLL